MPHPVHACPAWQGAVTRDPPSHYRSDPPARYLPPMNHALAPLDILPYDANLLVVEPASSAGAGTARAAAVGSENGDGPAEPAS